MGGMPSSSQPQSVHGIVSSDSEPDSGSRADAKPNSLATLPGTTKPMNELRSILARGTPLDPNQSPVPVMKSV